MLKRGSFSVKFLAEGVLFREEYELPYRTEEPVYWARNMLNTHSTLYQNALERIAKDLGISFSYKRKGWENRRMVCFLGLGLKGIDIIEINEIHNHLILEDLDMGKEDKAKKYAEGLNKVGQSFDIYYVEQAFLDGWEECMKYLQSLPLDEASNRILYHGTRIGDKSTFND